MDLLLITVLGVITVAVVTTLAQRLGVAGPLLLVALGLAVGLLPFVEVPEIDPDFILIGVLPPLLYAAAVRLPAIEFRRDFTPIAGLAVVLVVVTALTLGVFFSLLLPGVGFPLGVALGAILSPTDAVATGIARRLGITPRVITMLEGESLLNDATALVLLRTALLAVAAGSFSFGAAIGSFAWAVLIAGLTGAIVGYLSMRLRSWVRSSAASTAIGFTVPFLAYLPSEHLGGSGLVAAVVAGIVAGQGAQRWFTPEQRFSDEVNWRTVELVLEGGIFLIMGLELDHIVRAVLVRHEGIVLPTVLALSALVIILVVRALYVTLLLGVGNARRRRHDRSRLEHFDARLGEIETTGSPRAEKRATTIRGRLARMFADLDYYQATPLGWKHGTVIVWAGMRGVVTLAAAQTIPRTVDGRAELIYIAFIVALVSLMLQGLTLPWLVRVLRLGTRRGHSHVPADRAQVGAELRKAAALAMSTEGGLVRRDGTAFDAELRKRYGMRLTQPPDDEGSVFARDMLELRLAVIVVMRARLIELASGGTFSTKALRHTMAQLDADQLSIEMRLRDGDAAPE